ncbi:type VI secretion system Vgr family protein [Brucella gallinifaecis]
MFSASKPKSGRNSTYLRCPDFPNHLSDILTEVFGQYQLQVENRLADSYRTWNYCVQFQESDFNFISRLMEHEGIYYYFTHQQSGHTLVLADAPGAHQELSGYANIPYLLPEGGLVGNIDSINSWCVSDSITPSLYSLDDYDFRKPRAHLLETRQNPASFAKDKAEVFDWPGHYTDQEHGQFYVKVRQQELEAQHEQMGGEGNSLGIAPGYRFQLTQAPRPEDNRAYLVISARYFMQAYSYATNDNNAGEQRTEFQVVPADFNWRPQRTTPWPKTHGPQTAEVVGPTGETIWTDKYGRVKLNFRWDRYGNGDETSSCWVRVSNAWAGWKYGGMQIPRIGEEVVVDFINGDPDRPIIIGRVYNEDSMPPWDLPGDATKMGFMSRSKDGGADNASFLFMEDAPGRESFDMHAERDMNISVEKNKDVKIDGNHTTHIGGTEDRQITGRRNTIVTDHETSVFSKGQTVNITGDQNILLNGNRIHTIENKETKLIKQGQDTVIEEGDKNLTLAKGNMSIKLEDGNLTSAISDDYDLKAKRIKIHTVEGDFPKDKYSDVPADIYIHGNNVVTKSDHVKDINYESRIIKNHGSAYIKTYGTSNNINIGAFNTTNVSATNTINVGAEFRCNFSSSNSIMIGSTASIFSGMDFKLNTSLCYEVKFAMNFSYSKSMVVRKKEFVYETHNVEIKKTNISMILDEILFVL